MNDLKISAVVIAKNAEKLIVDCLESIKFCDEVIVIDSGSKDKTVQIAKRMGARIFEISNSDFSEMRNLGLQKAVGEWILYVDTDERINKELESDIKNQISKNQNEYSAFRIKRKNFYYGNHEWPYIEKLERLFKKEKLKGWYGKIHESPSVDGKIGIVDGFLLHYTHQNLSSMVDKTMEWSEVEADLRFKSNHPKMTWWRFPRVMITAFFGSYIKQKGYKAGVAGLVEGIYQSFSIFITYARLWELQKKQSLRSNDLGK